MIINITDNEYVLTGLQMHCILDYIKKVICDSMDTDIVSNGLDIYTDLWDTMRHSGEYKKAMEVKDGGDSIQ